MTKLDMTDKEIALKVLKRLRGRGLRSLRPMADQAPVSRGTLARWQKGEYTMRPQVRSDCLTWLGLTEKPMSASYAEGVRDATRRFREEMEATLERVTDETLRALAATPSDVKAADHGTDALTDLGGDASQEGAS